MNGRPGGAADLLWVQTSKRMLRSPEGDTAIDQLRDRDFEAFSRKHRILIYDSWYTL